MRELKLGQPATIEDLKAYNANKGCHFFDFDTMKFFRSKVYPEVFVGADGWYFITSEQFEDSEGNRGQRKYTVRIMREDGSIDELGGHEKGFQKFGSKKTAVFEAKYAAEQSKEAIRG